MCLLQDCSPQQGVVKTLSMHARTHRQNKKKKIQITPLQPATTFMHKTTVFVHDYSIYVLQMSLSSDQIALKCHTATLAAGNLSKRTRKAAFLCT